jgi:transcription elongation GreA/GreB family factor
VSYQIVGEDGAAPREGRVSYVSPIAQVLLGAQVGDELAIGEAMVEAVSIR